MSEQIVVKARIDPADLSKAEAIIRKVHIDDAEHTVIAIYGLTATGEWIERPEGSVYPEACRLPVIIYDTSVPFDDGFWQWHVR